MNTFSIAFGIGLGISVLAAAIHYAWRGRGRRLDRPPRTVRRFGWVAILLHAVLAAALLALAATGWYASATVGRLDGWLLMAHLAAAAGFVVSLTLLFFLWADACRFEPHDLAWLSSCWRGRPGPAEQFNAWQKAFFWLMAGSGLAATLSGLGRFAPVFGPWGQHALLEIHRHAVLLLAAACVLHWYFDYVSRAGTLTSMVTGRVSADWAEHHHPLWWSRIKPSQKGTETDES